LKEQMDARLLAIKHLPEDSTYSFKPLKGCSGGVEAEVTHLTTVLEKMICEDAQFPGMLFVLQEQQQLAGSARFSREVPVAPDIYLAHAAVKQREEAEAEEAAALEEDDEELLELEDKYVTSKFATVEMHGRGVNKKEVLELWRVEKIFWCEKSAPPSWCAECVGLDEAGEVPKKSLTSAGGVLEKAKVDFILTEMDADIERFARHALPAVEL
jgi:hypothetical protein